MRPGDKELALKFFCPVAPDKSRRKTVIVNSDLVLFEVEDQTILSFMVGVLRPVAGGEPGT